MFNLMLNYWIIDMKTGLSKIEREI